MADRHPTFFEARIVSHARDKASKKRNGSQLHLAVALPVCKNRHCSAYRAQSKCEGGCNLECCEKETDLGRDSLRVCVGPEIRGESASPQEQSGFQQRRSRKAAKNAAHGQAAQKLGFWVAQRFQRCGECSRISEGFSRRGNRVDFFQEPGKSEEPTSPGRGERLARAHWKNPLHLRDREGPRSRASPGPS